MSTISRIAVSFVLAISLLGTGCAEQKGKKKEDKKEDKKDVKQAEKK